MATVTAFEAKTRFGQLLERVAHGEEIVITKHDKPVARIIAEGKPNLAAVRETVASLKALRQRIAKRVRGQAKLSLEDVKSAVAAGRK